MVNNLIFCTLESRLCVVGKPSESFNQWGTVKIMFCNNNTPATGNGIIWNDQDQRWENQVEDFARVHMKDDTVLK